MEVNPYLPHQEITRTIIDESQYDGSDDADDWIDTNEPDIVFTGPVVRLPMREVWGDTLKVGDVITVGETWGQSKDAHSLTEVEARINSNRCDAWSQVYAVVDISAPCDCPSFLDQLNWPSYWNKDLGITRDQHMQQCPKRGWHRHISAQQLHTWDEPPKLKHSGGYYITVYENSAEAAVQRTSDQWRHNGTWILLGSYNIKQPVIQLGFW